MHQWQHVCGAQQPPPFALAEAAAGPYPIPCSGGGHLALVIQPRHVAAPARVDAVAWALLTLYAHVDVHIKRFQGAGHAQLQLLGLPLPGMALCCFGRTIWATLVVTAWAARSLLYMPGQVLSSVGVS